MNPLHSLRHAAEYSIPGSHLKRVRISRETAQTLLKLSRDRTNRAALRQSLHDADLNDRAVVGPVYAGAGTCTLWADTKERLLAELGTTAEQYRQVGAV